MYIYIVISLFIISMISICLGFWFVISYNPIKYRYIPKPFDYDQTDPIPIADVFDDMFTESSPWFGYVKIEE